MRRSCTALWFGMFLSASIATGQEAKKEATIVGEWQGEMATRGGKDRPVPEGGITFTFKADGKFIVKEGNREEKEVGTYKSDAKKNPAELDISDAKDGRMVLAIYKIDGDTMTLCMSDDKDAGRPAKFESPDGSRTMLVVFKRAKK